MNALRKITDWLWLSKERMVLAIMVLFLIFRVYQVVFPGDDIDDNDQIMPNPPAPEPGSNVKLPGAPPAIPPPPLTNDWSLQWRRSIFDWGGGSTASTTTSDSGLESLKLERLQEVKDGVYRARVASISKKYWLSEGDKFETYELLSIDGDTGCAIVFSDEEQKRVEICIE